jgi:hypothetical protein
MSQTTQYPERWLGEIKDWRVVEANYITHSIGNIAITGKILIGPHDVGAQAFIPPGVWANTPEDFAQPVSDRGWRRGVWTSLGAQTVQELQEQDRYPAVGDESKLVWVDGTEKPISLRTDGLKNMDYKIKQQTPDKFSGFAEEITANRIQQLKLALSLDETSSEQSKKSAEELRTLTANATAAFGSRWVKDLI